MTEAVHPEQAVGQEGEGEGETHHGQQLVQPLAGQERDRHDGNGQEGDSVAGELALDGGGLLHGRHADVVVQDVHLADVTGYASERDHHLEALGGIL